MTLDGRLPVRRVTLADNTVGEAEIAAVTDVLTSRWLTAGPVTRAFEEEFAAALGVPDAVAVSSGTASLHLAVLSLGLRAGDEVILPSLSFVAAAAVVALHGGVPVFADVVSSDDLTVAPAEVRALLTSRTRAVIAMHYGGYPARITELRALTDAHGIPLIEDAAHAPMVRFGDRALGAIGDLGCFSFHATKNMTMGEGGMVVAADPLVHERIRAMRSHSLTRTTWERALSGGTDYDVNGIGLNYRPSDIGSAIGRVQLGRLPADRDQRRRITGTYRELLPEHAPQVSVPFSHHQGDCAYHLMAVELPEGTNRAGVQEYLRDQGVQTSVHYRPTHLFSHYRGGSYVRRPLRMTEMVADRLLTLPLHSRMDDEDVAHVVGQLAVGLDHFVDRE